MTPDQIHSLISDTVLLVVTAAVYNLYRQQRLQRRHNYPLPKPSRVPPPPTTPERVEEELGQLTANLYRKTKPEDEAEIDTLAELARALTKEQIR